MKRARWICGVLLGTLLSAEAQEVRTWTTADGGRTIEAEFVSSSEGKVKIRRKADRKVFELSLDAVSEADRDWVAAQEKAAEEAAAKEDDDNPFSKMLTGEWERGEGHGLSFRLYGERKLKKLTDEGYPLVVYLHGRGGDVMTPEQPGDARAFSTEESYRKRPCFILATQCPEDESWDGDNAEGVVEIIKDLVKNLGVDQNRIYLTGYSMGAYGTFHLLGQEPKLFAAAVPVAGGGNPSMAEEFKKVPLWVFHGAKDDQVKVTQSQAMVEALEKARGTVKYTEFPDDGHGISGKVYGDEMVHEWLFEQSRR